MEIEPPRQQGDEQVFKPFTKTNYEEVLKSFPGTEVDQKIEWVQPELLE
jgi:hypothetical protein